MTIKSCVGSKETDVKSIFKLDAIGKEELTLVFWMLVLCWSEDENYL